MGVLRLQRSFRVPQSRGAYGNIIKTSGNVNTTMKEWVLCDYAGMNSEVDAPEEHSGIHNRNDQLLDDSFSRNGFHCCSHKKRRGTDSNVRHHH